MHTDQLLLTLCGGLTAALCLGYVSHRLRFSPIVGYLLAGIVVGPNTPGFTADIEISTALAELGVVLLLFSIGLQFDLLDLIRVWRLAIPAAIMQCILTSASGLLISAWLGWSWSSALVLGISIAFASTVVVSRLLAENNLLHTKTGHAAVGWLIVQDLIAVLALVLLPALASSQQQFSTSALTQLLFVSGTAMLKVCGAVVLVFFVGGKLIPLVLKQIADTRSRELFTLAVLVVVLLIAVGAARLFGISTALGAFLAGVVIGRSDFSLRAANDALPLRDAFAVLVFVSIGMLFDPRVLWTAPQMILATLGVVLVITPLVTILSILILGYPLGLALRVGFTFGQIGEFSFIVANAARSLELLPMEALQILVTVAIVTICISPLVVRCADLVESLVRRTRWSAPLSLQRRFASWQALEGTETLIPAAEAKFRAVIVGFGPVGRSVARLLAENGVAPTIIELNHASLPQIRNLGYAAVLGDANHAETLRQARVDQSLSLILSASTTPGAPEIIRLARQLNPQIKIIARTAYLGDRSALLRTGADTVFTAEGEVAMALAEFILRDLGASPEQIDRERDRIREEL